MKKCRIFLIFLCAVVLINIINFSDTGKVFADDPAPFTAYEIEFENGNKIFYMYPYSNENDDYLKSGLYYNKDPLENIYLINNTFDSQTYFYQGSLVFSTDGIYFANLPWTSTYGARGGPALEFYKNGSLIKQYYVSDLVMDKTKLEYSVSHVSWENTGMRKFDPYDNILSVTTKDNVTIRFDFNTGKIIDKDNDNNGILIAVIIISCILVLVILVTIIKRYKSRSFRK